MHWESEVVQREHVEPDAFSLLTLSLSVGSSIWYSRFFCLGKLVVMVLLHADGKLGSAGTCDACQTRARSLIANSVISH